MLPIAVCSTPQSLTEALTLDALVSLRASSTPVAPASHDQSACAGLGPGVDGDWENGRETRDTDRYGSQLYALAILFRCGVGAHLPRWKRAEVFGRRMGQLAGYLATAPSKAGDVPKMLAAGGPHQAHNGNLGARIRS